MIGRVICDNCKETYINNVDDLTDNPDFLYSTGTDFHVRKCPRCKNK